VGLSPEGKEAQAFQPHTSRSPLESSSALAPKAVEELKAAAPSLSIELTFVSARTPEEILTWRRSPG